MGDKYILLIVIPMICILSFVEVYFLDLCRKIKKAESLEMKIQGITHSPGRSPKTVLKVGNGSDIYRIVTTDIFPDKYKEGDSIAVVKVRNRAYLKESDFRHERITLLIVIMVFIAFLIAFVMSMFCRSRSVSDDYSTKVASLKLFDEEFVSKIENAQSQVEYRDLQEQYYDFWKDKYDETIDQLIEKCTFQEDKDAIEDMRDDFENYLNSYEQVKRLEITNAYTDYYNRTGGNGTYSRLKYEIGKEYRDAVFALIE